MGILNKLTIKHLTMNKKRTTMSIIGILLSTALMVGIGLLCSSIREYLIYEIKQSSGIYHSSMDKVPIKEIDKLNHNSNVDSYFYEYLVGIDIYKESTNEWKPYLYVNAVNKDFFADQKLLEGRFPENDTEIVIPKHLFEQGNATYKVGESITLQLGQRFLEGDVVDATSGYTKAETIINQSPKTYKIVGLIERSKYEDYSSAGFILYTIDNLQSDTNVKLYIVLKNPNNAIKISQTIYKNLGLEVKNIDNIERFSIDYNNSLLSMYGASSYNNITSFFISFLSIFLSIISVACAIVIYNSFAISVMERKKQFGLFSSIGSTKKQLRQSVLFEALIVGSIGIILGILSAYLGIGLVILIVNNLLKSVIPFGFTLITYPLFVIIPIIFIILTVLISAYLPARKASKISPIDVIRQNDDIKIKRRKLKTPKLLVKLFGVEGEIALKNMKRNKRKYRITIISLFISIVTFIAFSAYLTYGTETMSDFMGSSNYDIVIGYSDNYSESVKNEVNDLLKNEQVDDSIVVKAEYISTNFLDKDVYKPDYYKAMGFEQSGIHDLMSNVGMILNILNDKDYNAYKELIGLKEDRPIFYNKFKNIDYTNNNRKIVEYEVYKQDKKIDNSVCNFNQIQNEPKFLDSGFDNYTKEEITEFLSRNCYYSFNDIYLTDKTPYLLENIINGNTIVINESMYQEYLKAKSKYEAEGNVRYRSNVFINVYIKAEKYDKLDELGKKISGHYMNLAEDAKVQGNLLLVIKILFYGFIILVTLIGVTSVFNTIYTSINLRKKEFSVLRSIGLTPHGFNKMIWYESIFFGIKALIYGIPVGLLLSYLIHGTMTELVSSPFVVTIKPIIISIVGIFAIIILTMWYSTRKIKKENILESIRNENI